MVKLVNPFTGDTLEVQPMQFGRGVVLLNGRVVEEVVFGGPDGITTASGRVFRDGFDLADYLLLRLRTDAWQGPSTAVLQ